MSAAHEVGLVVLGYFGGVMSFFALLCFLAGGESK